MGKRTDLVKQMAIKRDIGIAVESAYYTRKENEYQRLRARWMKTHPTGSPWEHLQAMREIMKGMR
jgi:hypothetical protein